MLHLGKNRNAILFISLFLIFVGSRAAIINYGGNSVPYGDEWDGEAARVLEPYIQGKLTVGELFSAHNEHILFFTRLMTLLIFKISGYWDVILQMIANAVVDAATVVAVGGALVRVLPGGWAQIAMILSVLINALPLGWENILLGFNTHFYLVLAFSFASLWFFVDGPAWSLRWAMGGVFSIASFLCMASGALTASAVVGLHLLQVAGGRRRGPREWLGIATLAALAVTLVSVALRAPTSGNLGARSVSALAAGFFQFVAWPLPLSLGWIIALPSLIFCFLTFASRPPLNDARWFNVGAYGWILTQFFALAVGRAEIGIQNRYFDILLVGIMINLTSAFWVTRSAMFSLRVKIWPCLGLVAWLAVVVASLAHAVRHVPGDLDNRRRTAQVQAEKLRGYLATGDASRLSGVPLVDIPYLDAQRLRTLLDAPEIRSALPPTLLGRDAPRNWVETFKRDFLAQGLTLFGLGGLLLLIWVIAEGLARLGGRTRPCVSNAR